MEREFTYRTTRLSDSCNSYLYYGLHRTNEGWVFREWAPNATAIYLLGEFNDWRKHPDYALTKVGNGNWEIKLPQETLPFARGVERGKWGTLAFPCTTGHSG